MRVRPTSRRRIALCTALVLAVYAGGIDAALRADLSAVEILERAATAPERTNYKGQQATTIYYTPEPRYLVANLVHIKPFTTKVEMMLPAETAGRTMLFTENELRHYEPASQQLIISTIPGREIQRGEVGDLDLLRRNYEIRLVGTDRFLDRKTYNISLDPKFPGSSSRKLSIDTQTFVTLKSEEYSTGPERKLRVATYFASISFPKSISSSEVSLDVPKGVKVCRVVVPSRCASVWLVPLDFKPALPVVIPGGFAFKNAGLSVGKGKTLHLNFTNGDSKVSLFEAKRGSAGAAAASEEARSKMGHSVLSWSEGDLSFVLIGDVDSSVLKEFRKWISPAKEREAVAKFALEFRIDRKTLEDCLGSGVELFDAAEILAAARAAQMSPQELLAKRQKGLSTDEILALMGSDQSAFRRAMEQAKKAQGEASKILNAVYGPAPPSR